MKRCGWCDGGIQDDGKPGTPLLICDDCVEMVESGEIQLGRGYTSGRCPRCNIRFIWKAPVRLKRALCIHCHTPLRQTTHLFRRGRTEPIIRPAISGSGRRPVEVSL